MNHSGTISVSESWTVGYSPHILVGDVSIALSVTVSVDPNCTVDLNGYQISGLGTFSLSDNTILYSSVTGVEINYPLTVYINGDNTPNRLFITKGDELYNIDFFVKERSASDPSSFLSVDLTGATIKFKTTLINNIGTLLTNGTCTIANAVGGECYYTVQSTDFTTTGQYRGQLEITYASGEIVSAPRIVIDVVTKLG